MRIPRSSQPYCWLGPGGGVRDPILPTQKGRKVCLLWLQVGSVSSVPAHSASGSVGVPGRAAISYAAPSSFTWAAGAGSPFLLQLKGAPPVQFLPLPPSFPSPASPGPCGDCAARGRVAAPTGRGAGLLGIRLEPRDLNETLSITRQGLPSAGRCFGRSLSG